MSTEAFSTISRMPLCGSRFLLAAVFLAGCGPTGTSSQSVPVPPSAAPVTPSSSAGSRSSSRTVEETSFDDIAFAMEKGSVFTPDLLPERVTGLAGRRIRIRGYILPSFQQTGLTQFVLVRDNMECCFGPGAALYDCIVVRMVPGQTTDFSIRPVAVTGTFRLEELKGPDGKHLAIYAIDGEAVQ